MKTYTKEEFIEKHKSFSSPAWMDFSKDLNSVIQQAIAEHEAKQWHYLPERPEHIGRKILVEYPRGSKRANDTVQVDFEMHDNAIRWRELPEPYKPE